MHTKTVNIDDHNYELPKLLITNISTTKNYEWPRLRITKRMYGRNY